MHRLSSLDLLRGIAAFSVAIPHFLIDRSVMPDQLEAVSVLAVEVFFVLSGFVLAPQILYCLKLGTGASLRTFLIRRWMRTVPPYLVALGLISYMASNLHAADFLRYAFYVQNLWRQHNVEDYFTVAWSLSIEEWFYVVFPGLLMLLAGFAGRRDRLFCVVAATGFIVAITLARTLLGDDANWGPDVRRVVVFRIDSIAYGFLLYIAMGGGESADGAGARRAPGIPLSMALFLISSSAAFLVTLQIGQADARLAKHAFPFLAAAFGASAIVLILALEPAIARIKWLAALGLYLGRISYSVYLFHLIFIFILQSNAASLPLWAQLVAFVACNVATSTVFYFYFERPILAARPGYARTAKQPAVAG